MTSLQNRMRANLGTSPQDRKVLTMPKPKIDRLEREIEAGLAHLRAIRADKRSRKDIEWIAQVTAEVESLIAWHRAGIRWSVAA